MSFSFITLARGDALSDIILTPQEQDCVLFSEVSSMPEIEPNT